MTDLNIDIVLLRTGGNLVLESVEFPGNHVAVTKTGDAKALNGTGVRDQVDGQFTVQVMEEQPKYHRAGTSVLEVGYLVACNGRRFSSTQW